MAYNHEAPVLCCGFSKDGQRIFSGGCDNKAGHMDQPVVMRWTHGDGTSVVMVKMKVLQTQQEQQIGQHDAPVKEVFVLDVP
eukprot:Skav214158  [mRNA]  locus=scaffold945:107524:108871:- [translate_table: standard]